MGLRGRIKNRIRLKSTQIYIKSFEFEVGRLVVVYSPEVEVAKRNYAIEVGAYNSGEARYMGYSLIYHNTGVGDRGVVKTYYERDVIEKAFKELKSFVNLHNY